jgi:hypothetical protein
MRREQIHKICLNFFLTDELELKRKEDNSWTFFAADFSEGEIEPTSLRFDSRTRKLLKSLRKRLMTLLVEKLQLKPMKICSS